MDRLEIVAALLGVANVVLLVRRSAWNYAFGIATVALYAPVFVSARLYSDATLQLFFLVLNVYGWANWARAEARTGEVPVARLGWAARGRWAVAVAAASLAWGTAMARLTDAAFPYLDGAVAMASIAAQWLQARRLIETWPVWIAVDVVAIGLYVARGLLWTAALYLLFLGLCAAGWRAWARAGAAPA